MARRSRPPVSRPHQQAQSLRTTSAPVTASNPINAQVPTRRRQRKGWVVAVVVVVVVVLVAAGNRSSGDRRIRSAR